MISRKAVGSMALVMLALAAMCGWAAEETVAELYGRGVHAYFAHDYDTAVALLSASIAKSGADPRAYYFRGLALAAQKGSKAGVPDFIAGAELEVNRRDQRLYDVNNALQRVQGAARTALEAQRRVVREAAAERKKKQDQVKYEELKRREDIVLFRPDQPLEKLELDLPEVDLGVPDPFVTGVAFTGGQQVAVAAPEAVQKSDDTMALPAEQDRPRDPFADPAKKTEDPFGAPNPFGAPKPATKKPAATTPAAKEPAATEPAAKALPADYNPFGDESKAAAPNDPLFDATVRPPLPPGMNVGGTILGLLGKTVSDQGAAAADRDPFGEPAPPSAPAEKPAAENAAGNPPGDAGAAKKNPPSDDPFADSAAPKP